MARRLLVPTFFLCAASSLVVGCGDDPPNRPPIDFETGPRPDANTSGDGSVDADADTTGDGGDAGSIPLDCAAGSGMTLFTVDTGGELATEVEFQASANVDGVVVTAPGVLEANPLVTDWIAGSMDMGGAPSASVATLKSDVSSVGRASIATSGSGYLAIFNDGAPSDLFVRAIDSLGVAGAGPTNITNNAPGATRPSLARAGTGFVLAYKTSGNVLWTGRLDASGAVSGSLNNGSATIPAPGNYATYVVGDQAYVAYSATDTMKIRTAPIDGAGALGTPFDLSASVTNQNFDVVGGPDGGGVVYEQIASTRTIAYFRAINSNGSATVTERLLVGAGESATRPSVATLAGGYFVVFRFKPAAGTAKLRLVILSSAGLVLGSQDLIDDFPDGVRHQIRISPDGEIYVVYNELPVMDDWGGNTVYAATVKALRIACQ